MKYNIAQRDKVIRQKLSLQSETVKKRKTLREEFPVEVEIEEGYYIIESKLNEL